VKFQLSRSRFNAGRLVIDPADTEVLLTVNLVHELGAQVLTAREAVVETHVEERLVEGERGCRRPRGIGAARSE